MPVSRWPDVPGAGAWRWRLAPHGMAGMLLQLGPNPLFTRNPSGIAVIIRASED